MRRDVSVRREMDDGPMGGVCSASFRASLRLFGLVLSAHVNMFPGFNLHHQRCDLIL